MKIKVVCKMNDDGEYEASSVVFPKCVGRGKTRGDALEDLDGTIEDYVETIEKGIGKDAHAEVHIV